MQRQILTLDNIPYLIEYRYASESVIKHICEFIMLRKYDIMNDLAYDKEIMFIQKDIYKSMFTKDDNGSIKQNQNLVFPYINKDYESFTSNIFNFLPNSTPKTLIYRESEDVNIDLKTDYYELLIKGKDDNYIRHKIECDVIRIYRPHNRKHIDSIISVSNLINDIHFHYFCQKYNEQEIHVGTEIKYNNNVYYEYIEFYVPSVESIFGQQDLIYNEDLNLYQSQSKYWNGLYYELKNTLLNDDNKALIKQLIMPFRIEPACSRTDDCKFCPIALSEEGCKLQDIKNQNVKTFTVYDLDSTEYKNSEYNFVNTPLVVTLTHYDKLDENSNKYLSLEGISPSSIVLHTENEFRIKSRIDFDKSNRSIISVISEFDYPKITNADGNLMNVQEAYFYFNKITDKNDYWNFEDYDDEIFLTGLSDALIESLKFNSAGYVIEMSLNTKFDQVFYRQSIGAKEIDDFTFNLDNIFSDWKEYPEVIFIRTLFIDKFLSKVMTSNLMVLTKEKFKYCINNTTNYRVKFLDNESMKTFTFIDKINCTIKKHDVAKEVKINGNSNSTIIYKTVFYKVQDSQNIRLRASVTQNIGINLGEYLSKVSDFKLRIDGYEFTESGRNDVYVLFTVPASQIITPSGKYDIIDGETDAYITSGNYVVL